MSLLLSLRPPLQLCLEIMSAVLRVVHRFDELVRLHLAHLRGDSHLPFRDVNLDLDNPFDLFQCLLDRVAALLSHQAPHFEHENLMLFAAAQIRKRKQRQTGIKKQPSALRPAVLDSRLQSSRLRRTDNRISAGYHLDQK